MSTFTSSLINESRFQVRNHWDGELLGSFPDRVTADYVQYLANYQSFRGSRLDGKPLVLLPREKSPVYDVVDQLEDD